MSFTVPKLWQDMPKYLVNLERSPDRLASAMAQIQGIERFPAVDGRQVDEKWCEDRNINIRKGKPVYGPGYDEMANGQRGCALSHVLLLQKMVEENIPCMMVFEDDIRVCEDFENQMTNYWNNQLKLTGGKFDVIYVGNQCEPSRDGVGIIKAPSFCTHGLIWTLSGAKKVLQKIQDEGLRVIDILMIQMQSHRELDWYSWIKGLNDNEKKLNLHTERSSGLVFQSKDFETTIDN